MNTPLSRATRWVDDRIDDFRINGPKDAPPSNERLAALKALAELAHAANALIRSGTDPDTGRQWLEFAWEQIEHGEVLTHLVSLDPKFSLTAIAFLPFHLADLHSPRLYAALTTQIEHVSMGPLEWALLGPTLQILKIVPVPPASHCADEASVLATMPPMSAMAIDAVYLFAHECLYACRWGRRVPEFNTDQWTYIERTLTALTVRFRDSHDPDVLAEIILATHGLGLGCAPQDAWRVLYTAQTKAGNIVPKEATVDQLRRLHHPRFTRTYHSTLVAIMAFCACLSSCTTSRDSRTRPTVR